MTANRCCFPSTDKCVIIRKGQLLGFLYFSSVRANPASIVLNTLMQLVTVPITYCSVATPPSQHTAGVCFQTTGISPLMTTTVSVRCLWHFAALISLHKTLCRMNTGFLVICICKGIFSSRLLVAGGKWQRRGFSG